jgi:predicted nucleotidyltransferase
MPYGLSESVIEKLLRVFSLISEIDEAILFGSRVKGTFKEGSDIDIALKGTELNMTLLRKIELDFDNFNLPYKIDLVIYSNIEEPLLTDHINRIGISIYKKTT